MAARGARKLSFLQWQQMTRKEFDKLVERAIRSIPARFRRRVNNLVFVVEDEGPPGLLGLYQGRPLPKRSIFESFSGPDRIVIFQRPHERMAKNRDHLQQLVARTVWHELAHYFGFSEKKVRALEQRWGWRD